VGSRWRPRFLVHLRIDKSGVKEPWISRTLAPLPTLFDGPPFEQFPECDRSAIPSPKKPLKTFIIHLRLEGNLGYYRRIERPLQGFPVHSSEGEGLARSSLLCVGHIDHDAFDRDVLGLCQPS